ncbi:hypothetical protein Adu01nite_63490 [Paractinoplanes durhamensis]|uniref:Uncharacterized protein n=1 Tax=Paractinoplanes durhamensis TaxID=113563 RepID=A0ABQ3Z5C3_9ACTN|nr:hypothetical protein Adu01nite_63490 [Actinoplanes durhamensis]
MPERPRVWMAPARVRLRQASLTVVGLTPSSRATSRTVGSRVPTGRLPALTRRPTAAAIPLALRSSTAPVISSIKFAFPKHFVTYEQLSGSMCVVSVLRHLNLTSKT